LGLRVPDCEDEALLKRKSWHYSFF